jgi:hypothetical protein
MRPADQYAEQDLTRVQSDPAILYASLELSQSSWLVTSLSPGSEKICDLCGRRSRATCFAGPVAEQGYAELGRVAEDCRYPRGRS